MQKYYCLKCLDLVNYEEVQNIEICTNSCCTGTSFITSTEGLNEDLYCVCGETKAKLIDHIDFIDRGVWHYRCDCGNEITKVIFRGV